MVFAVVVSAVVLFAVGGGGGGAGHLRQLGLGAAVVVLGGGGAALRPLELGARLLDGAPSWRLLRLEVRLDAQPPGGVERRAAGAKRVDGG